LLARLVALLLHLVALVSGFVSFDTIAGGLVIRVAVVGIGLLVGVVLNRLVVVNARRLAHGIVSPYVSCVSHCVALRVSAQCFS